MKRKFMVLMVLFFLLSACAPVEDRPEVNVETAEPATSPESSTPQIETAAPTDTPRPPTEVASATESQPATSETAPTPVSPFTGGSIGPGHQEAYSFISSSGEEIIFWLYLPEAYDGSQTWPLIISLHGFLGFEPSLEIVREQSPPAYIGPDVEFPFIVISPRAPSGSWALYHEPMEELIELLGESLSIDPDAQFLTGFSTGVIGTWQWALAFPDRFTGIALIAGTLSLNPNDPVPENICLLKDLPVWVAHSEADREVPIESNRAAVMALEECGSTVTHFTAYADLNHADSISMAYAGPELYDWMFALMDEES
jgi:pimeloyl-ACP methyl ester carboxylesterase